MQPPTDLVAEVEDALGCRATHWHKPHTGLSAAHRFVVSCDNGEKAYVKAAADAQTADWLRSEHTVLAAIDDDFVPAVLYWDDGLLITEDLSHAYWPADHPGAAGPVTWLPGQVEALLDTLDRVARAAPGLALPTLGDGLLSGDALVHNDVRSDNVCFLEGRVVLVDWSNARRGNAQHDATSLALTVAIEGGPDPFALFPTAGAYAAWHAAELKRRIDSLGADTPSWLRGVLERLLAVAREWSARCVSATD